MRQIALLTVVIALLTNPLFSQKVSKEDALKVGMNFYKHYAGEAGMAKSAYNVKDSYAIVTPNDLEVMYTFNLEEGGYFIVSANMLARPILAYSYESNLNLSDMAPATKMWIDGYMTQIEEAVESKSSKTSEFLKLWDDYYSNNFADYKEAKDGVLPLVKTRWAQTLYYNYYCPIVPQNYPGHDDGEKCVTGCVATAMAQVMKYYNYPPRGNGYGTYYWQEEIRVDYSTYNWDKMPERLSSAIVEADPATMYAVAELIFQAGVSVNMQYGPIESGTYLQYAINNPYNPSSGQNPFVQNFGYRGGAEYKSRSVIPTIEWKHTLINELNLRRPVLYGGNDGSGNAHAFVCDGFQGEDFFHFNWGWEGQADGYFSVDATASSTSVNNDILYPVNQNMIVRLAPSGNVGRNFLFCKGEVIYPFIEGSFDDGSGPNNYFEGTNCEWLVTLEEIEKDNPSLLERFDSLKISFNSFKVAEGDLVTVYNGKDATAPVLGVFSGRTVPPSISTTGKNLFITFVTNDDGVVDNGWEIAYSIIEKMDVGVNKNDLSKLAIYPNPANDFLKIEGIEGSNNSVKIFDIYGKLLVDMANFNDGSINISNLSNGVYVVRVENERANKTMKFVKQ